MGKALVLKNVDFSANRLGTVVLTDIPCTGITLNQSTATVTNTLELTATVTPTNTTDSVVWTSTDEHVATVNSGTITAKSNGTATIKARCGNYEATCAITVSIPVAVAKGGFFAVKLTNNNTEIQDYTYGATAARRIAWGAANGSFPVDTNDGSSEALRAIYPYPIPNGAKTIKVTRQDVAPLVVFFDSTVGVTVSGSTHFTGQCAKVIDGESPTSGNQWSIQSWDYDERTITIPNNEAIDSFTLGLLAEDTTAYDNFDTSNPGVTIEFGY